MTVLFVRVYYMKYHVKIWHAFKGGGNVEGSFNRKYLKAQCLKAVVYRTESKFLAMGLTLHKKRARI
jgi:hypothetical protein